MAQTFPFRQNSSVDDLEKTSGPIVNRARVPRPVQAAFDLVPKSNVNWSKDSKKV
jgi:hypothetical protein